jgi:hypothetical protein
MPFESLDKSQLLFLLICSFGLGVYILTQIHWPWFKKLWKFCDNCSQFAVAVGTLSLALFTVIHIKEAQQMRIETKKIAEISIKQFQASVYPSFLIEPSSPLASDSTLKLIVAYEQKSNTSSHDTTAYFVSAFNRKNRNELIFNSHLRGVYQSSEVRNFLDLTEEMPPNTKLTLESNINLDKELKAFDIETSPKYLICFIRFWIPYDYKDGKGNEKQFRYRVVGFTLRDDNKWQRITVEDTHGLVVHYIFWLETMRAEGSAAVLSYLRDYLRNEF